MRILALVALYVLVAGLAGAQTTWQVDASAPSPGSGTLTSPFPSIQAGILAAVPGDTVVVASGTYPGPIDFSGKAITVTSAAGPAFTTIDGNQAVTVVSFSSGEGPDSVLDGFTVTNGQGTIGLAGGVGGIHCESSSPSIFNCRITNNVGASGTCTALAGCSAGRPGGVSVSGGAPRFINCEITGNSGGSGGSAAAIGGTQGAPGGAGGVGSVSAGAVFLNCIIANNSGGPGGTSGPGLTPGTGGAGAIGGLGPVPGSVVLTNCTIALNLAGSVAGVLSGVDIDAPSVVSNSIIWNVNSFGGANVSYSCVMFGAPGVGNFGNNPQFVNPSGGDVHIRGTSPCIDAGISITYATDIDGDPRRFYDAMDIGADEFVHPSLRGNVGGSPGETVLSVNGETLLADVPLNAPVTIAMAQPTMNPLPSSFVIYGAIGFPGALNSYTTTAGDMGLIPYHLAPSLPGFFVLTNNFVSDPAALIGSTPAPWSVTLPGLLNSYEVTFQGVIAQGTGASSTLEITNAVLVAVHTDPPPVLASATPACAGSGETITISGSGLQGGLTLNVGGLAVVPTSLNPNSITFTMPFALTFPAPVVVTNPDGQSASLLIPNCPLSITSSPPPCGSGGSVTTVTGTGFMAGLSLTIGGVAVMPLSVTSTQIVFVTPASTPPGGSLVVTNPNGQSVSAPFSICPPVITSVAFCGVVGTTATVFGSGFQAGLTLALNGMPIIPTTMTANAIAFVTPAGVPLNAVLVITNPDGQTAVASFSLCAPGITSINPLFATAGTPVVIIGSAFQSGLTLTLDGVPLPVTVTPPGQISFTSPATVACNATITITNPDGSSASTGWNPGSAITSLSSSTGPPAGGVSLTINGQSFDPASTVTIGGSAATIIWLSYSSITVVTPPGTPGPTSLVVTAPSGCSLTAPYTYAPFNTPTIMSITPNNAAPGAVVIISGQSFDPAATVSVGGIPVTPTAIVPGSILFTNPAGVPCDTTVDVTNPNGQSSSIGFNATPVIISTLGSSGPAVGGSTYSLQVQNLPPGTTVTIGGTAATILAQSPGSIVLSTPPGTAGPANVVLTTPAGCTATTTYTYL